MITQGPNDNSMLDMLIGYPCIQIRISLLLLSLLLQEKTREITNNPEKNVARGPGVSQHHLGHVRGCRSRPTNALCPMHSTARGDLSTTRLLAGKYQ